MLPCTSPLSAYQRLTIQNPSPYMFYMQDQEFTLTPKVDKLKYIQSPELGQEDVMN
ncbi:hypothetical protein [Arsenophonus endosymbiont of Bemisia tabaci]|uniref:hypothetical protein n=1 Tax=Arsenophonus endosymbiont of Bemisia tabaci TaxID=536059 RepID=UPI003B8480A0